jgi:hypothetical protein
MFSGLRIQKNDQLRVNGSAGTVVMASENGKSVLLTFHDGGLRLRSGIFLKFCALTVDYESETVTELITGEPVEVEVKA